MNKLIEELYTEAREDIINTFGLSDAYHNVVAKKFAELIVQECCNAVKEEGNNYAIKSAGEAQANWFVKAIEKHFGVE